MSQWVSGGSVTSGCVGNHEINLDDAGSVAGISAWLSEQFG